MSTTPARIKFTVQGRRTRAAVYTRPLLLYKNASLSLELRFCFHKHHRRSKPDFECATTSVCPAAHLIAPQYPKSTLSCLSHSTQHFYIHSISAITTLQMRISPSVSRESHSFITDPVRCPTMCPSLRSTAGGYAVLRTLVAAGEQLLNLSTQVLRDRRG